MQYVQHISLCKLFSTKDKSLRRKANFFILDLTPALRWCCHYWIDDAFAVSATVVIMRCQIARPGTYVLCIGIENIDDILADLEQALAASRI